MPQIEVPRDPMPEEVTPPTWRDRRLIGLVAALALVAGLVIGALAWPVINPAGISTEEKALPPGMANYEPRNAEERTLLKGLRAPTFSEAVAMGRATSKANLPIVWRNYIATQDVVLPSAPLSDGMVIGLPAGVKWKSGPLTNIMLVVTSGKIESLALDLRDGLVIYDRWCTGSLSQGVMTDKCPHERRSTSDAEMHRNLRPLGEAEFAKYPGLRFVPNAIPVKQGNVFLATDDVVLHPYTGGVAQTPVIVLGEDARIIRGDFGRIQVVGNEIGDGRQPDYEILHDPVYTAISDNGRPMENAQERIDAICGVLSAQVRQQFYTGLCPA